MAHGFQKFISEVFVNGKFPKILPSKNFPLYSSYISLGKILVNNNIIFPTFTLLEFCTGYMILTLQ